MSISHHLSLFLLLYVCVWKSLNEKLIFIDVRFCFSLFLCLIAIVECLEKCCMLECVIVIIA